MAVVCVALACCAPVLADLPLGHKDFMPSPRHPVGFRGDWTGKYPGATPPLRWSTTQNVIWKAEVGVGESSPIIVGDKVFQIADGIHLRCLRASDGQVLWHRQHHVSREGEQEAMLWKLEEYVLLHHRRRPLLEAIQKAKGSPTTAEFQKHVDPIEAEIKALGDLPDVDNRSCQVSRNISEKVKAGPLTYAIATPCSDGKFVYAWLPTGLIVCYDLEGRCQWRRILGTRRASGGWYGGQISPAPVLADGKLVIHYDKVYCLEAASGKVLWETPQKVLCIPSPIAGSRNGRWFVALGPTQILRMSDGRYVEGGEASLHHDHPGVGSPIFIGDSFCWLSHAMQLPADDQSPPKLLWELLPSTATHLTQNNHVAKVEDGQPWHPRGMGWHHYGSPLEDNGIIYYHHEGSMFSAIEARTGKWLYTRNLVLKEKASRGGRCGGAVYPGLSMAGQFIFAIGSGGVTCIIKPGTGDFEVVAENRLEDMGGNRLVFSGTRMFVHVGRSLYCIGE